MGKLIGAMVSITALVGLGLFIFNVPDAIVVPSRPAIADTSGLGTGRPVVSEVFSTPLDAARSVHDKFELVPDEHAYGRWDPTYTKYTVNCEYPYGKDYPEKNVNCNENGKILVLKYYEKTVTVSIARRIFLERARRVVPLILEKFPEADGVAIRAYSDFVDIRGNNKIDQSFTIRIDRKNSDATNWPNVKLDDIMKFADVYWQDKSVTAEIGDPNAERDRESVNRFCRKHPNIC